VQVSQLRKTSSIASIFLVTVLFFLAIIGGYSASGLIDQGNIYTILNTQTGIDFMSSSIHSLFVDSIELAEVLDVVVDETLDSISSTLSVSLKGMNVFLQDDVFGSDLTQIFSSLTGELVALHDEMQSIVELGDGTQVQIVEMKDLAAQINIGNTQISDKIIEINSALVDIGGSHQLKVPFPAIDLSATIPPSLFAVSNISAAVDPLRLDFVIFFIFLTKSKQ
jgi:hypothetical protein